MEKDHMRIRQPFRSCYIPKLPEQNQKAEIPSVQNPGPYKYLTYRTVITGIKIKQFSTEFSFDLLHCKSQIRASTMFSGMA